MFTSSNNAPLSPDKRGFPEFISLSQCLLPFYLTVTDYTFSTKLLLCVSTSSMEFILDFQGFKDDKDNFIIKELAIISTDQQVYELHLFRPPCAFQYLSKSLKDQVVWLERCFHGLVWNSGFRDLCELKDILLRVFNRKSKVFVKGIEKAAYISELLKDFVDVEVINFEILYCPNLEVLRRQISSNELKPCSFNHSSDNCAYMNAQRLLIWWKVEKAMLDRMEVVNLAIKECHTYGYKRMSPELVRHLPKDFILNHPEDVEDIYERLPGNLKNDVDVINCLRCNKHFYSGGFFNDDWDGKNPKRKNCHFCKIESKSTDKGAKKSIFNNLKLGETSVSSNPILGQK